MNKQKRTKAVRLSVLVCILAALIALSIWYPYRTTRHYTACVMNVNESSLLIRLDAPKFESSSVYMPGCLYWVKSVKKTKFISHDPAVKTAFDLQPGALIKVKIENFQIGLETIYPSIYDIYTVTRIETTGKTDEALFQAGVEDMDRFGFKLENGKVTVSDWLMEQFKEESSELYE